MKTKAINPLVDKYGSESRWVTWRLEERKGKKTKIPYTLSGSPASSTDPSTWTTYPKLAVPAKGIVFTPSCDLFGIDLDKCLRKGKGGSLSITDDRIAALMLEADTYVEVSPSGTGLHLYFALSEPLKLMANRHEGFEAYTEGRYFTVTGEAYRGLNKPVRTIEPKEALRLLALIGYPWGKKEATSTSTKDAISLPAASQHQLIDNPADIIAHMFRASNGEEIRKLYEGDMSAYKDDASRADMALLSHLAFWTQKDASAMEAIWLASPLGKREKTQKRADYRKRSIDAAIEHCTEVYTPQKRGTSEMGIDDPQLDLLYVTKKGERFYFKNMENVTRIILHHPEFEGTFRFDDYCQVIDRKVNGVWRNLRDSDVLNMQSRISVLFMDFANVSKEMVFDGIANAADINRVDTGADYLRGLSWDKEPRLDSWVSKVFHTPDDEYHRKIGANWLKGLVKRVIDPGSKFDYVLVLEGEQGIKKSTALLMLAGALGHVETTVSTENKDFYMQMLGNAVIEFSEGETLSRTETKRLKAIITVQIDKFRAPYGRSVVPHPRRCVFAMTTNQSEYLKDETGNRRWLPVAVEGQVDIKWIEENREQLLAEAYHRVITGKETVWEFPEAEMQKQQNLRRIQDPNADPIVNWYVQLSQLRRDEGVMVDQVFREGINSGFSGSISRIVQMGIADVLKTTLMLERRRVMVGGILAWRWYPTEKTKELVGLVMSEF